MGSPEGTPEAAGRIEAFRNWWTKGDPDSQAGQLALNSSLGKNAQQSFEAGWEAALKFRAAQFQADRDHIDAEEQAQMAADPDYIAHQGRWCGKFYGIAPGVLHHKDSCYK